MTGNNVNKIDVLIAGGGFAGLTLAIALRKALGSSVAVTVADPALVANYAKDERASAIVAGEPFAHMIENRYLVEVLAEQAKADGIDLLSAAVRKVDHDGDGATAELAD